MVKRGVFDGSAGAFLMLAPVGLVAATLPFSVRDIRREFSIAETMPLLPTVEQFEEEEWKGPQPEAMLWNEETIRLREMWMHIEWNKCVYPNAPSRTTVVLTYARLRSC